MGRVMAIDYGTKRVGLAVSDPLKMIANGMETVHPSELITLLADYHSSEPLETIVIGEPKRMNNEPSQVEESILEFIKKLQKALPDIAIERFDERFTSKIALQAMIDGGVKKEARKNKALVDKVSATLILQQYLDQQTT